ncbi:MAG: Rdx family protein [Thermoanaerobaculia bacterium]
MPRASSLGAEIKKELGIDPKLVRGSGGVFNVIVGNETIYSKHETGEFPSEREIVEKLKKM